MSLDVLYTANEWLIVLAFLALMLVANEAGFRLGCRIRPGIEETARAQSTNIQGAVLALLGLLLAFTFSMAVTRYDLRRQLVVEESTAIGTTYLRAQLLPEPYRTEISRLLRDYVNIRLEFFGAGADQLRVKQVSNETDLIQDELWMQAIAVGTVDPHAITTGLFLTSLNETIDIPARRLAALHNRIPEVVILLLLLGGILAVGVVGYGYGLGAGRNIFLIAAFSVLITLVVLVIIDLDRPRRGLITISQQSMLDLRESMDRTRPWEEQGLLNPDGASWLCTDARETPSLLEAKYPRLGRGWQSIVAMPAKTRPFWSTMCVQGTSSVLLQSSSGIGLCRIVRTSIEGSLNIPCPC